MNLRRGLLRLWIVLALVWVTGTTWLLWDELTVTKHQFVATFGNHRFTSDAPERIERMTTEEARKDFSRALPGLLAEAYKRGLLPADMKSIYEECEAKSPFDPNRPYQAVEPPNDQSSQKTPIRAESADGVIHEFPAGTPQDVIDRAMKMYAQCALLFEPQLPGSFVSPITEEYVANWARRREAAAIVFLPPFGVLLVGFGLSWAAQGFRKPS